MDAHAPRVSRPEWRLVPYLPLERTTDVPVVSPPDDKEFRRLYLKTRRPVVLRGLCASWTIGQRWTFPQLKARLGHKVVRAVPVKDGVTDYDESAGLDWGFQPFPELAESLESAESPRWFLMLYPETEVPELKEDLPTPEYSRRATWIDSRMTLAGRGSATALHFELQDNLFCLCSGEKEFLLFPPTDTPFLYPRSPFSGMPHVSRVDMRPGAEAHFPWVAHARPHRCLLRGGDVLLVPRLWWHATMTNEPSIGLGYWWAEGVAGVLPRAIQLYKRARGVET
jgi:hypothetical protein